MLAPGASLDLSIEKAAAGGRMIARADGQIVFVTGAIPGEVVRARIDRVERHLAFATAVRVLEASPDRREPSTDPLCGGCVYSHIAYTRQLRIKGDIVEDAFRRLARLVPPRFEVVPSPERAYRMRARFHVREGRAGFYREGTHSLCDAGPTGQMRPDAVRAAEAAASMLLGAGVRTASIELTENIAADERALHVDAGSQRLQPSMLDRLVQSIGLTGVSARGDASDGRSGHPSVADPLRALGALPAAEGSLSRSAESFFQANRFLVPGLVGEVSAAVPDGPVLDLYAGVGLFSVLLAAAGRSRITAVEGDRASGSDLQRNAAPFASIRVVLDSVERHLQSRRHKASTFIVDPPRTGISRAATAAMAAQRAPRIVYVSCDPATMARDVRRLVDAGYRLDALRGFDLFPNTPHVECVGVLTL